MLLTKKSSYCIKLLHLALALSLLHVDPESFLQHRWDSQLELSNGNGWELEMLRAVPLASPEYPYANRKNMLPLIEDLVLYDRYNETNHLRTECNVTAYQLFSDGSTVEDDASGNQTSNAGATALQSEISLPLTSTSTNIYTPPVQETTSQSNETFSQTSDLNLFLSSELFHDQMTVWEQNVADLNDFGDLMQTYANIPPLKDEPNVLSVDINLESFLPSYNHATAILLERERVTGASNGTFPEPNVSLNIKIEELNNSDEHEGTFKLTNKTDASCSNSTHKCVKKEKQEHENATASLEQVDLSPFINAVELTKEESEIVEVLWKQDVDLGYSLTPRQVLNATEPQTVTESDVVNEEREKLKALEECKLDKIINDKDFDFADIDINNEWSGIPFTIDNETGEYIRLPLDDLFKDVLELDCLQPDNNVRNDISGDLVGASTSQAAFAAENKKKVEAKKDGDHDSDNEINNKNSKEEGEKVVSTEKKYSAKDSLNNEKDNKNKENNDNIDHIDAKEVKSTENNQKEEEGNVNFSDFEDDLPSPLFDLDDEAREEIAELDMMIQSAAANFHHHHHSPHPHGGRTTMAMQNYAAVGGANSAFHRQAPASGFHHHQGRLPLSRSVSMEQHLQDIASLFNPMPTMGVPDMPTYAAYAPHPAYSYQTAPGAQHAQYPHPPPPPPHVRHSTHHHSMLHANAALGEICAPTQPHYGHNLGSAVTSSMHLTNASHEGDLGATTNASNAYKMEQDMMYYSNVSSEMNHTTDGFINSILNDEDLHLMDMNVNNEFCRMVDVNNTSNNSSVLGGGGGANSNALLMGVGNPVSMTADLLSGARGVVGGVVNGNASGASVGDRLDASSDSAVSSMGSERVPSLSDGEWGEGSDSAQDYHHGKYAGNGHGPYDYSSYNNNNTNSASRLGNEVSPRQPPVAQKKHQMFGKRFFNEQNGVTSSVTSATAHQNGQDILNAGASIKYEYEPYALGVAPTVPMQPHNAGNVALGPAVGKEHEHDYVNLKYGGVSPYSIDFTTRTPRSSSEIVQHNHTYHLPQGSGSLPRPQQRDKKIGLMGAIGKSGKGGGGPATSHGHGHGHAHDDEHLSRDEKRARALNIPITVNDIINLPMDEFNERLSKYDLNENQLSLIRDVRRRGKNKVAAQNCRKRKLDQILSLEDEVKEVRRRKDSLQQQREDLYTERKRISNKFASLHRHIFQYLRDAEGNPCSPTDYSLQLATDGSVYLLPRDSNNVSDAIAPITSTTPAGTVATGNVARQNVLLIPQQQQQHLTQNHVNHHAHHNHQQQPHQRTQQQPTLLQHNTTTMQHQQQATHQHLVPKE